MAGDCNSVSADSSIERSKGKRSTEPGTMIQLALCGQVILSVDSGPLSASRPPSRTPPLPSADILQRGTHRGSAAASAAPASLQSTLHLERGCPAQAAQLVDIR